MAIATFDKKNMKTMTEDLKRLLEGFGQTHGVLVDIPAGRLYKRSDKELTVKLTILPGVDDTGAAVSQETVRRSRLNLLHQPPRVSMLPQGTLVHLIDARGLLPCNYRIRESFSIPFDMRAPFEFDTLDDLRKEPVHEDAAPMRPRETWHIVRSRA